MEIVEEVDVLVSLTVNYHIGTIVFSENNISTHFLLHRS